MLLAEKASDVRNSWAKFIDEVMHDSPKFVKRNERDVFASMNLEYLSALLENIRYKVFLEKDEETGEFIATMEGFHFVETGNSPDEAIHNLANELIGHAVDFYKDFKRYYYAPDFKEKFSKLTKALITEGIEEYFDVEYSGT